MGQNKSKIKLFHIINQLSKKSYARLTLLLCLIVAFGTAWMYRARYLDYLFYQYQISYESTHTVGPQISEFVEETRRLVQLYTDKNTALLQELDEIPDDYNLRDFVENDLRQYFPKMLTFTLANADGVPYWEDFDGLIGELCQTELKNFAAGQHSKPAIHPIHDGYHFDVMAKFNHEGKTHILFVSFLATMLGELLSTASSPDHEVMLVLPAREDLIEVVQGGARDIIKDKNDYHLTQAEIQRILVRIPVANTQWDVIDLVGVGVLENYKHSLIVEALSIIVVFTVTGLTLVFHLWRTDNKRELAVQQRKLIQRQKDSMIAMITHEFRTPLTAIHGALELMRFTLPNDYERSLELQQIAARNTKRLQLLVNDFLDLKQLESSEFTLNLNREDLAKLVDESISTNSTYAEQFNVTIKYEKPALASSLWIHADAYRINQVITNLLSNAIKYGGENKSVEVRLEKLNEMARVEISDQGDGIPIELQKNLFKSFSMLSGNTVQRKVKSSGLGLSIVKSIVEKHGGTFELRSLSAQGTTFFFELPLINEANDIPKQ